MNAYLGYFLAIATMIPLDEDSDEERYDYYYLDKNDISNEIVCITINSCKTIKNVPE